MLSDVLNVLPQDVTSAAQMTAVTGAVVGGALWLMGARFSRSIVTLVTVSLGCVMGLRLPTWAGWGVDGMATGVLCAVILGVSGFVYHRFWVALGVGMIVSAWAGLVTWSLLRHGAKLDWPDINGATTPVSFCMEFWNHLPADVKRVLPVVTGSAMFVGVLVTALLPMAATVVLWSMVGVSLVVALGATKVPAVVPGTAWAQAAVIGLLVVIGATIQWKLATVGGAKVDEPSSAPKKVKKPKSKPVE